MRLPRHSASSTPDRERSSRSTQPAPAPCPSSSSAPSPCLSILIFSPCRSSLWFSPHLISLYSLFAGAHRHHGKPPELLVWRCRHLLPPCRRQDLPRASASPEVSSAIKPRLSGLPFSSPVSLLADCPATVFPAKSTRRPDQAVPVSSPPPSPSPVRQVLAVAAAPCISPA